MGFIEEMKWWHWMVVSLLVGAALGYINVHNVVDPSGPATALTFERYLMRPPLEDHGQSLPWITNIKLFPPKVSADGVVRQMVTYMWRDDRNPNYYVPTSAVVTLPFVPEGSREKSHLDGEAWPGTEIYRAKQGDTWQSIIKSHYGSVKTSYLDYFNLANQPHAPPGLRGDTPKDRVLAMEKEQGNPTIVPGWNYYLPWTPESNHTLRDFLDEAAKDVARNIATNPKYKTTPNWITYKYQWWHDPKYAYRFFVPASFVVIGLIWPAIMHFLVLGGLGRKPVDDYDLSRFKGGKESKPAGAAVVTDADRRQLQELQESLEASLKSSGTTLTTGKTEESSAAPVKKLNAAPLEAATTAPPPEQKKDYKGEYYPVVRPDGKPADKKN